jgi:hypothetical protein
MTRRIQLVFIIIICLMLENVSEAKSVTNLPAGVPRKTQDIKRIDPAGIPLNEEFVIGEKSAEKKVIIFSDPD